MNRLPEGLDQRFLDFIGVTEENEREVHAFYLQFFQPGQKVVDLGCGAGYLVKMLREKDVEAIGVDQDPAAQEKSLREGTPIIQGEAISYLQALPEQSLDGIISAHLVEHLEEAAVYTLIAECYRTLKPGGLLLLTMPNVRAILSHLEMFWLHFDHKRFYHPRLLEFFMQDCGFARTLHGENGTAQDYPFFSSVFSPSSFNRLLKWEDIVPQPRNPILYPWWRLKQWLAALIVVPYMNAVVRQQLALVIETVDRPFEVYVLGYK